MKFMLDMLIFLIFLNLFIFSQLGWSKERTIYKYKQHEYFDLSSLEIKGEIIAPGDISVQNRKRFNFKDNLFERNHFNTEIYKDIYYLR